MVPKVKRMSRVMSRSLLVLAATVSAVGVALAVPSAASAASSCWGGPRVHELNAYYDAWYDTRYCPTWTGTEVYSTRTPYPASSYVRGYLYAGTSWFVCQTRGADNPALGGALNDWWLFTMGDTATDEHAGWGWIPATAVSYGGNWESIPGVPFCTNYPGYLPY